MACRARNNSSVDEIDNVLPEARAMGPEMSRVDIDALLAKRVAPVPKRRLILIVPVVPVKSNALETELLFVKVLRLRFIPVITTRPADIVVSPV